MKNWIQKIDEDYVPLWFIFMSISLILAIIGWSIIIMIPFVEKHSDSIFICLLCGIISGIFGSVFARKHIWKLISILLTILNSFLAVGLVIPHMAH